MSASNGRRGDGMPTIVDVAARAGVSKSLVSLALRGSPQVREEKRLAILRAAEPSCPPEARLLPLPAFHL